MIPVIGCNDFTEVVSKIQKTKFLKGLRLRKVTVTKDLEQVMILLSP